MNILQALAYIEEFVAKDRNNHYFLVDNNTVNSNMNKDGHTWMACIEDGDTNSIDLDDTTKAEAYGETMSDAIIKLAGKLP